MKMLLRNRKTQGEEKNWSIILNPLHNEIDKRRVIKKISEAFTLSVEEAADLVANTPIILLDNLSREQAVQVKRYFQAAGAEIMLTNDTFLKRKCYRTVWPEPPSLSFLHGIEDLQALGSMQDHPLEAEDALHEIQSDSGQDFMAGDSDSEMLSSSMSSEERDKFQNEAEHWKNQAISHQAELVRLRQQFDQLQRDHSSLEGSRVSQDEFTRKRGKDVQDMTTLLSNMEEKYEGLKQEYREMRVLLEEKLSGSLKEVEDLNLQKESFQEKMKTLEKTREDLERAVARQEDQIRHLEKESRDRSLAADDKLNVSLKEAEQWKSQHQELYQKYSQADQSRQALERTMDEKSAEVSLWRDRHQTLIRKIDLLQAAAEEDRQKKTFHEEKNSELEKSVSNLMRDLETKSREVRHWETKALELEKNLNDMKQNLDQQARILEQKLIHIEARERELENMRRQLKDATQQLEQREAVQRRMQLVNQVAEKETKLKKLVKDQEAVEAEIREREESMRKILLEQESLEKEIVDARQTERHLMEQLKKDKEKVIRIKPVRGDGGIYRLGQEEANPDAAPHD